MTRYVYPYAKNVGKTGELLRVVRDSGRPDTVSTQWLKSVGLGSSNDRPFVGLLKALGFVDDSGRPTARWSAYRGPDQRRVLGEGIREAYRGLFETYEDASERSAPELEKVVKATSDLAGETAKKVVGTFCALCKNADMPSPQAGAAALPQRPTSDPSPISPGLAPSPAACLADSPGTPTELTININVQLTLPATDDQAVYDRLFASLKRHLLEGRDEIA